MREQFLFVLYKIKQIKISVNNNERTIFICFI